MSRMIGQVLPEHPGVARIGSGGSTETGRRVWLDFPPS
jgi:acyl-CoA reductase-like NAD-dependent aldehyde dehydrogenase